jgi:hypothetical protein
MPQQILVRMPDFSIEYSTKVIHYPKPETHYCYQCKARKAPYYCFNSKNDDHRMKNNVLMCATFNGEVQLRKVLERIYDRCIYLAIVDFARNKLNMKSIY